MVPVLIVDPDADRRERLCAALTASTVPRFAVRAAMRAVDADVLHRERRAHAIVVAEALLDIPVLEWLDRLPAAEDGHLPAIVLLLSGPDAWLGWDAMLRGAADFLEDRWATPDLVRRTVAHAVASRARRRARATGEPADSRVARLRVDADGRCVSVGGDWCALAGSTEEKSVGADWLESVHPDDRDRVAAAWRRARASRTAFVADFRLVAREEARATWVATQGVLEDDGAVWTLMLRDVTARREAEDWRDQLSGIVEASTDFIGFCGLDGRSRYCNPAGRALIGFADEASALGVHVFDHYPPSELPRLANEMFPAIRREETWTGETVLRHRVTDEPIPVAQSVFAIRGRDGAPLGVATIARDIRTARAAATERTALLAATERARAEAAAASAAKDRFLAVLSHELRTPLGAMLNWLTILRQRGWDETTFLRAVTVLERNVRQQARLVDDLLDVSRIESGKLEMTLGIVDLAATIEECTEAVRPDAEAKGVVLAVVRPAVIPKVQGDADRLRQVVANLVGNAMKFTPAGGRIETRVRVDGHTLVIEVADSGRGIDPAFLPYVFDRFRQAESGHHGGLGLGLAIVRYVVERHGGAVQAWSEGPGHGATFTIRLPCGPPSRLAEPDAATG